MTDLDLPAAERLVSEAHTSAAIDNLFVQYTRAGRISAVDAETFKPVIDGVDEIKFALVRWLANQATDKPSWFQGMEDGLARAVAARKVNESVHPTGPHDQTPEFFAWPEIDYSLRMQPGRQNNYYVEFSVWKITALGENDEPHYGGNPSVTDPDHADPVLTGSVKWDGCINMSYTDRYTHWCGPDDAQKWGQLLIRIYDQARIMLDRIKTDGAGADF